jgi:hypothetical protein
MEEALRDMDAAGVDRGLIDPPSWDADSNGLAVAAVETGLGRESHARSQVSCCQIKRSYRIAGCAGEGQGALVGLPIASRGRLNIAASCRGKVR